MGKYLNITVNSNCSKLFDFNEKSLSVRKTFPDFPRFNISPALNSQNIKFKSMNIGSGTTGTRSINELLCNEFSLTTLHWIGSCNTDFPPSYPEFFFQSLISCINGQKANKCETWIYMNMYTKTLEILLTRYDFGSDFPIAEMFPDILHYVPQLSVLYTLRDPNSWAHSRIDDHGNTPICHPSLWDNSAVLHPFDMMGCLSTGKYVNNVLLQLHGLQKKNQIRLLVEAYHRYNKFTWEFLTTKQVPVLPICLWDTNHTNSRDQQQIFREFWNQFASTEGWLTREPTTHGASKMRYRVTPHKTAQMMLDEAKSMGIRWRTLDISQSAATSVNARSLRTPLEENTNTIRDINRVNGGYYMLLLSAILIISCIATIRTTLRRIYQIEAKK